MLTGSSVVSSGHLCTVRHFFFNKREREGEGESRRIMGLHVYSLPLLINGRLYTQAHGKNTDYWAGNPSPRGPVAKGTLPKLTTKLCHHS